MDISAHLSKKLKFDRMKWRFLSRCVFFILKNPYPEWNVHQPLNLQNGLTFPQPGKRGQTTPQAIFYTD